jgi:uncharacterized membrane protein
MTGEDFFVLMRMFHVVGVVLWIGGVAFIALVLLPTLRSLPDPENNFKIFAAVEGRFKRLAKVITMITGLSGFFMLYWMDAWHRYQELSFWWVHLMTFIWVFFTLVLFVVEPILIKRNIHEKAMRDPAATLRFVNRILRVVVTLGIIAAFGAVSGVHG